MYLFLEGLFIAATLPLEGLPAMIYLYFFYFMCMFLAKIHGIKLNYNPAVMKLMHNIT